MNYIVIDIGGTSIKGGYFIEQKLINYSYKKTNGKLGRERIIHSMNMVILNLLRGNNNTKYIVVSSAGNIDPYLGKCVYASKNLSGWTNFNIKDYLEYKFKIECLVENDACMHLLGEINIDNLNKSIFMMTLGTGVGSALYKNNNFYYGDNFDLGKFQHYIINENGLLCDCGKKGCAEKEISSSGLKMYIKDTYNEEKNVKELFDLYRENEPRAVKLIEEYFVKLRKYIDYILSLKVDEIIIGGGFIKSKEIFEYYLKDYNNIIKYAHHGALSALYGGYNLLKRNNKL